MTTFDTPPATAQDLLEIDLSVADAGDPDALAELSRKIDHALRTSGAFTVAGHGVRDDLVRRTVESAQGFFALPDEYKERFASPNQRPFHGWTESRLEGTRSVRTRESFEVGRYDSAAELAEAGYGLEWADLVEPNVWPRQPAALRSSWTTYHAAMDELCDRVLSIVAPALDLRDDWFVDKFDRQVSYLVAHHYPPQFESARVDLPVMGTHADFGTLSVFHLPDGHGGMQLQAEGEDGCLDVAVPSSQFLVCAGEVLARWTNGRWRAAPHRVRALGSRDPALSRTSLAYFQFPNLDARIEPVPSCERPGSDPEPSLIAGEWAHFRLSRQHPAF
jgi:isopenicillin N synthase-like dioxygenase